MIEAVMYVALGFCTAGLIGLAILPAFYRRAARLTEEALRAVNPSSYAEVRAAQDQARARHAIELRRVERQLDGERSKAARHHLEAARLRTEIDELNRSHKSQISDLETKLGSLHGDQRAVDLLTSEVTALKQKLADSEKALAESWKLPDDGKIETRMPEKDEDGSDWLPAADTMTLATITGLEAEVATLKSRLAKHEPIVAEEIATSAGKMEKSRLSELEAQLVDTNSKYVSAQAEVTRLSHLLSSAGAGGSEPKEDLTDQLEELTRENAQQRSELNNKERALERATGQVEKLKIDLANTPALSKLREEFRALAAKIAGANAITADAKDANSGEDTTLPVADVETALVGPAKSGDPQPGQKKRTQRVIVPGDKIKKPATIKVSVSKVSPPDESSQAPKSADIASAAEALVSRVVASNRKTTQEESADDSKAAETTDTSTGTEPDAESQTKSVKQKKKDVA